MLRQLKLTDYNDFFNLISEFRNTNFSLSDYTSFLNEKKNLEIWVYEYDGLICGTATLFIEQKFIHNMGKVGHIEDVIISDKYRGYGFGKNLIKFLIERGKNLECYKLVLTCNNNVKNFYTKCGFNDSGINMDYRF